MSSISLDPETKNARSQSPKSQQPSDVVQPTRVDTQPQQAGTQPGDGSKVHVAAAGQPPNVKQVHTKVPWKEQVIAYAQKTRGTLLRKPSLKEHGDKVLTGEKCGREPPPKE